MQHPQAGVLLPPDGEGSWPVLICLLGDFRLLRGTRPEPVRAGAKAQGLLRALALRPGYSLGRDALLCHLWPGSAPSLAGQSLNTLVYSLHRLLGDSIGGAAPVVHADGSYRLNVEAGVGVDIACFDALAEIGDRAARAGEHAAAAECHRRALEFYRGDLCGGADVHSVIERERLRARCLTLFARLADHHYGEGDYAACMRYALLLLAHDPCREDAHRLVMRCCVRQGQRAQALRQYRLCEEILRREFDAAPEPATRALFDQARLDPSSI